MMTPFNSSSFITTPHLPKAELHLIDGGHFLLEEHSEFVAGKITGSLAKGLKRDAGN